MNTRTIWIGLAAGLGVGLLTRMFAKKPSPCAGVGTGRGTVAGIPYLETVHGSSNPSEAMPMIISFHSRGGNAKGANNFGNLGGAYRVIRPQGFTPSGGGYLWFTPTTSDPDKLAMEMYVRSASFEAFLRDIVKCRHTLGRPIVTGSSQGGNIAYLFSNRFPSSVGGAVAVLGYLPPEFWNSQMSSTVGLHTTEDPAWPKTSEYWGAMKAAGADLETATAPGGHSVPPELGTKWRSSVKELMERQRA